MSAGVLDCLQKYAYPGNVRELIHIIERMFTMSEKDIIDADELPEEVLTASAAIPQLGRGSMTLANALNIFEEHLIRDVLKRSSNPVEAAHSLGVHYSTLWRKVKKYGLSLQK
jgi:transcriptional regulator with PAS, ATPase and Fis domain